mmetsp:Transcript_19441/g.38991  ORF Transcript_19441/g.38991 Transcript_19441/m.38991 type:complete len:958 (-) Transcript_19441:227-3100(-)
MMKSSSHDNDSDVYHMDVPNDLQFDEISDDSSNHRTRGTAANGHIPTSASYALYRQSPQLQARRPPVISTEWDSSVEVEDRFDQSSDELEAMPSNSPHVTFNIPANASVGDRAALLEHSNNPEITSTAAAASTLHFQNPKWYGSEQDHSYPTQRVRGDADRRDKFSTYRQSPADIALERAIEESHAMPTNFISDAKTPVSARPTANHLEEVTPAFLRRAAQDSLATHNSVNNNFDASKLHGNPQPPNSLSMRRDKTTLNSTDVSSTFTATTVTNNYVESSIPDSSFYGADASALDSTFVSIRDLNDDDDVPSIDNEQEFLGGARYSQWSGSNDRERNGYYANETTSLLGKKKLPWQGGFFGSEVEKKDRKERMRMMRAQKGWLEGWYLVARSAWREEKSSTRRDGWFENHPIGELPPKRDVNNGFARQRGFSIFLSVVLCSHIALCGLHDLFLQYLSYRHPENNDAGVSWNGEGRYTPAYWPTLEGRVLNPCIGPGARTLTAFGALVPGIVLSGTQRWRIFTTIFQTSSLLELLLHLWAIKTAIGGHAIGLEWRRGSFVVASLFVIAALIGSAWSITLEPGNLITASVLGITGLLAAAMIEQSSSPEVAKADDDGDVVKTSHNNIGGGSNVMSASSNEQFTFEPPTVERKPRRLHVNFGSPILLLALELIFSFWAPYASFGGTIAAAVTGIALSLIIFAGNNHADRYSMARHELLSAETPPPPPPYSDRGMMADDDDSADTSIGAGRQPFNTPLMRKSILADEEDDEEAFGSKSSLRRRKSDNSSARTPGMKGQFISINKTDSTSPVRALVRVIGVFAAFLLTLIPASLIASMDHPSSEMTRASVLGCKPMRVVYRENDNNDFFECAGGCIPLSRTRIAKKNEGMRDGRCDSIGYRCWSQAGTLVLRNYEVDVGIYHVPSSDGSCGDVNDDEEGFKNNDDASADSWNAANGEVEGVQ